MCVLTVLCLFALSLVYFLWPHYLCMLFQMYECSRACLPVCMSPLLLLNIPHICVHLTVIRGSKKSSICPDYVTYNMYICCQVTASISGRCFLLPLNACIALIGVFNACWRLERFALSECCYIVVTLITGVCVSLVFSASLPVYFGF